MASIEHNHVDIAWLNEQVRTNPEELLAQSERQYEEQLEQVAGELAGQRGSFSILLASGPSASTKTTTAGKLAKHLEQRGLHAVVISLDDFFLDRSELPVLPDGTADFESIHTLDLAALDHCFCGLLYEGGSDFPIFDFTTGKRAPQFRRITAGSDTVVLVEGIHALNPEIVKGLDPARFRKAYISPNSDYRLEGERVLRVRDVRLIRRLIRDYNHRANTLKRTFEMWQGVIKSEVDNIFPYRAEADYIIDSAILYEPNLYRDIYTRLLEKNPVTGEFRDKAEELRDILAQFTPLPERRAPETTVLHEFLK